MSIAAAYQRLAAGEPNAAEHICLAILNNTPENREALHLLGIIALQKKDNASAIAYLRRAAAAQPQDAGIANNLGMALLAAAQVAEAIAALQRAVQLAPHMAEAWYNLGKAWSAQGNTKRAIAAYRQALAQDASLAEAWNNLGNLLAGQGDQAGAIECFQHCLRLAPHFASAWYNLAIVLSAQRRFAEAENALQQALRLQPHNLAALMRLGWLCFEQSREKEGLAYFQQATLLAPNDPQTHFNLGHALLRARQPLQAAEAFRQALARCPNFAEAHNDLGSCLLDIGEVEEALSHFQRAAALRPDDIAVGSNILLARHYREGDASELYRQHCAWASRFAAPAASASPQKRRACLKKPRLRLGYLSPDFRQHPVGHFIAPIIAHHDRQRFAAICFSNGQTADTLTERIRAAADEWYDINGLDDDRAAALIQEASIDILVDLAGHTCGNRLAVFARKPAPIQITYLGYPNTTGLPAIDWRITDSLADPPGHTDHLHCERLLRLDPCFLCYVPLADAPPVMPSPALSRGLVTFGSFNNLSKISPPCLAMWAKILTAVPNSRLILKSGRLAASDVQDLWRQRVAAHGIAPERIMLRSALLDIRDHLAAYSEIDIALDTYPYHGTTTTCEALWMGVPVITLAGNVHASRVGVSLLHAAGLENLIADTPYKYIELATALANDLVFLSSREARREKMRASALTDINAFMARLERAYLNLF
ncbi:MAG: tetratricopeptide repeat protein [Planctomycetota bacterium]|nr:tetratricopeptide repeat protein [Planctomycetota bacterium]